MVGVVATGSMVSVVASAVTQQRNTAGTNDFLEATK